MMVTRKLLVGRTHGRDKLMDLGGVLDALGHSTPELTSTASVLQRGRTCKMPSVTFAGVSPPLKTR
jgi:hypothetical protein